VFSGLGGGLGEGDDNFTEVFETIGRGHKPGSLTGGGEHGEGEDVGGVVLAQVGAVEVLDLLLAGDYQANLGIRTGLLGSEYGLNDVFQPRFRKQVGSIIDFKKDVDFHSGIMIAQAYLFYTVRFVRYTLPYGECGNFGFPGADRPGETVYPARESGGH
jgi:hypothetical protein